MNAGYLVAHEPLLALHALELLCNEFQRNVGHPITPTFFSTTTVDVTTAPMPNINVTTA